MDFNTKKHLSVKIAMSRRSENRFFGSFRKIVRKNRNFVLIVQCVASQVVMFIHVLMSLE